MRKTKKDKKRTYKTAVQKARSRRRSRKYSGLSEMFNPAAAAASGKGMVSGAIGGAIATMLTNNLLSGQKKLTKIAVLAIGSFVTGALIKMPNVAAGMAGTIGAELVKPTGLLSEDEAAFSEYEDLQEMPLYLDEAGEPLYLAEDLEESEPYQIEYAPTYAY